MVKAGVIDAADHWAAGTATVVQVGDQLDRGGSEIAILLLLERCVVDRRCLRCAHPAAA
jgi:hypothetical protein